MHSQVSIKHHLRTCARKFLANLATCPHCARPCQKEDLPEHQRRCAKQRQAEESNLLRKQLGKNDGSRGGVPPTASLQTFVDSKEQQLEEREQEQLEKAKQALLWKQRMADIKNAFIALERGELGLPDKLGRFACGVCGEKFRLQAIVPHEKKCRERLATDGKFGGQMNCPSTAAPSSESETESVAEKEMKENRESSSSFETRLAALRSEIYSSVRDDVHVENSSDEPAEDAWSLAVERLKAVIANATTPRGDEKKFRRLKKKNEAFHHALGRWTKAVEIMKTELGFVETTAAASSAAGAGGTVLT
eukprot:g19872.t1